MAVGDCCIFQFRDSELIEAFPISDPTAFTNTPTLLTTNNERNDSAVQQSRFVTGSVALGDIFVLATDAAAQFLLERQQDGTTLNTLRHLMESDTAASIFLEANRNLKLLRNDDVAIALVELL